MWGRGIDTSSQAKPLDDLYVHAGEIEMVPRYGGGVAWAVSGSWQLAPLPTAKEYWVVFRYDRQLVPDISTAPMVGQRVQELLTRQSEIKIAGVQLDIDSPTGKLPEYAAYLAAVKKSLPKGRLLSITALLDWFRDGTDIEKVIGEVDEFVPQFYDAGKAGDAAIATKVDAATWGPRFNRFEKRYRIGISTFGRARFVSNGKRTGAPVVFYREVTPLDMRSEFTLAVSRNDAGEVVLTYRAAHETVLDYHEFSPGDGIQFVIPTPESVQAATAEAKKMGGYAAGVIYFRWPGESETLVVPADEFLGEPIPKTPTVESIDGGCVAVSCVDLTLRHSDRLADGVVRYRVRASAPLEYFLPTKELPVRLSGANEVELTVPPFAGRDRFQLGRAVSTNAVTFEVEVVK